MKITLIYPGITECGFNSQKGNEGSWMNHGLAIISAALKNKGHEVNLIDLRRLRNWNHFRDVIKETESDAAGISMMSVDFNPAVKAASIIKEIRPGTFIIVGGPHPSLCPDELEAMSCFDCVMKGEGEITINEVLDNLKNGESIPKVIQGQSLENLDESPWADRYLFNCPEEPFVPFLDPPFVTLIAGRGCKYNCNYCQPAERIMFGKKVRRRSVSNVIDELTYLKENFAFNSFMIHDDCLTEDREWIIEFCKSYKEKEFNKPFVIQSRADIICRNRDMIETLYDAGLRLAIIGFESGSNRILKFLRKGCTRELNLEAARICHEIGIKIWANYMLGLPTETKSEALETLSMIEEIKPYHCSPAFYTPHPGSDLFTMGEKMGIHMISSHDSYRRNTYEPKIKGPDYQFLKKILYKSLAASEDLANTEVQVTGLKSKFYNYISKTSHNFFMFLMVRTPKLYHMLRNIKHRRFKYLFK